MVLQLSAKHGLPHSTTRYQLTAAEATSWLGGVNPASTTLDSTFFIYGAHRSLPDLLLCEPIKVPGRLPTQMLLYSSLD